MQILRRAGAQFILGMMYEHGKGVDPDDKEAVKWYRMAAEQGHPGAQKNLVRVENGL
ncbi:MULTISPECIES: tetratricopeptide repeat protein [unclassified Gammaproteobacteria]|uniref:tetratricopeptide repeat protein n=1 Tax=unclassified Gammaproteobacteria TaxID=33811 RepID=UPI0023DF3313|nr:MULTISPECIES: SEL1-like repeat protein [unclassified Gammaproteobacteria]